MSSRASPGGDRAFRPTVCVVHPPFLTTGRPGIAHAGLTSRDVPVSGRNRNAVLTLSTSSPRAGRSIENWEPDSDSSRTGNRFFMASCEGCNPKDKTTIERERILESAGPASKFSQRSPDDRPALDGLRHSRLERFGRNPKTLNRRFAIGFLRGRIMSDRA